MLESKYQAELIKKIRRLLPGCVILKNDPTYLQGVPDILILYGGQWAMLEVKRSGDHAIQPNQEHYVGLLNDMSFCQFITPETESEVLHDLQQSFGAFGQARVS